MPKKNPEVERLIRIRDKQLQARDPQKKISKTQQNISKRYRRSHKPLTAKGVFSDIPKKWMGFVIGLLFITLISMACTLPVLVVGGREIVRGSGDVVETSRDVSGFSRLVFAGQVTRYLCYE